MTRTVLTVACLALPLAACAELATSPEPAEEAAFTTQERSVTIFDACDPVTFNAVLGAGTCVNRQGGVTLDMLIEQLTKHQTIGSWRFSPGVIHVHAGSTLPAINRGGETHSFTRVAEFGGGFIELLNVLTGNPVPAPECIDLVQNGPPDEFVPAGGYIDRTFPAGESKWMCCIHPWMRAVAVGH